MKKYSLKKIVLLLICLSSSAFLGKAQSTSVDFPTPITSDEIRGKIPARDIGDSRLTTHYYVFDGKQGDIFINIEANNLNGDVDIFLAESLKPITKISFYADSSPTQTGRELYLRKPERLILRVEGRTPTDDAATYSIKFSGSFQTVAANSVAEEPELPKIKSETESEVKVNSVGTIIETKPKPLPTPKETIAANTTRRRGTRATTTPQPVSTVKPKSVKTPKSEAKIEETKEPEKKVEVIVTDNLPKPTETGKTEPEKTEATDKTETKPKTTKKTTKKATTPTKRKTTAKKATQPKPTTPDSAAELTKALENVRLIVEFKDGARIERPMNDVLKFGVDKGVLTIINKDGSVGKYSILEIVKISVE